ncbi:serum amyloid P-component-like [Carcharodon carcharias]|uniref:serum amyloid P-component-like n=1 Tax=Carcharodon carcharias TaxID=13397 RepID=UPI001B7E709B|nr:serum amyloid P-component-like [Carcharodon carcharias]
MASRGNVENPQVNPSGLYTTVVPSLAGRMMKTFILFVLVACVYQHVSAADVRFAGKALRFQTQTSTSYVRLYPSNCPNLSAFTLCFRAASEASHSYTLFSYATSNHNNELLIWKGKKGRLCLYLGNIVVGFSLPEMNALLRHICVTCESAGGLATFWVDGERSIRKVVKRGGIVHGGGAIILGQDQDRVGGGFDWSQSFVGEITDVNMWDHVLTASEITSVSQGCHCPGGNIIDWATIRYTTSGKVNIQDNNDCTV